MKRLILIIGLMLVIGLVAGCAGKEAEPGPTTEEQDTAADAEVTGELDDTYVEDADLDVGEMF